jgi:hypothetical protein
MATSNHSIKKFWRGFDLEDLDLTKIKSISDWFGFDSFFIWFDFKFLNILQNDLIGIWKLSKWFGFVKPDKLYQIQCNDKWSSGLRTDSLKNHFRLQYRYPIFRFSVIGCGSDKKCRYCRELWFYDDFLNKKNVFLMQNNNAYKCFILHNFADVYFNTFFSA